MKNIIIISYFYPPAYFVGGQRVASWAKYLHKFGVYPIIITRRWNENQADITNEVVNNEYGHEKYETHEIYYLPQNQTLRNQLHQEKKWPLIRKFLTLFELVFSYFFITSNKTYKAFYDKALEVLNQVEINSVIISGRPFYSFIIGYQLKKKFPQIRWIPDYRDEWTTHHLFEHNYAPYLRPFERMVEKKWSSNASFFLAPDFKTASRIASYIKKPFHIIPNGYDGKLERRTANATSNEIILCYTGTVYANQEIEKLVDAIIELNQEGIPIKMRWIGIELAPDQGERVRKYCKGNALFFEFYPIVNRKELSKLVADIDLYILMAYSKMEHVLPVKLFDYLYDGRPILFYPADQGEIHLALENTKAGLSFGDKNSFKTFIKNYYNTSKDEASFYSIDTSALEKYSRENKASELAKIILT